MALAVGVDLLGYGADTLGERPVSADTAASDRSEMWLEMPPTSVRLGNGKGSKQRVLL